MAVNINTDDLISVTDAGKSFSGLVAEAMDGRTYVVVKHNRPAAVITGLSQLERLHRIDDIEQDLRLWAIAIVRAATDNGERHSLGDVAREFGVDLEDED